MSSRFRRSRRPGPSNPERFGSGLGAGTSRPGPRNRWRHRRVDCPTGRPNRPVRGRRLDFSGFRERFLQNPYRNLRERNGSINQIISNTYHQENTHLREIFETRLSISSAAYPRPPEPPIPVFAALRQTAPRPRFKALIPAPAPSLRCPTGRHPGQVKRAPGPIGTLSNREKQDRPPRSRIATHEPVSLCTQS